MNATLTIQPETLRWRSREVCYYAGGWDDVLSVLPEFETVPFRAGSEGTVESVSPDGFAQALRRGTTNAGRRSCRIVTHSSNTVT